MESKPMFPKTLTLPEKLEFIGVPRTYGKAYGNVIWGMVPFQKVWLPAALSQLPDEYFDVDCLNEPIRIPVCGYVSFPAPDRALLRFEVDSEADYLLTRLNGEMSAVLAALRRQTRSQAQYDVVYTGPLWSHCNVSLAPYKVPFLAAVAWVGMIEQVGRTEHFTVTVLDATPKPPIPQEVITLHSMLYRLSPYEPPVSLNKQPVT
jgi:hypothetical protein